MPDFLISPCAAEDGHCTLFGTDCKLRTKQARFGLCDDSPPSEKPAYIQHYHPNYWNGQVENSNGRWAEFKAIDKCVKLYRADGSLESLCDGVLIIDTNCLHFVELKDRSRKGWLALGRNQITTSIKGFVANHQKEDFVFGDAYICNRQRPYAVTSITTELQTFKDETAAILENSGLLLRVERKIHID